tara:strand:+ start:82 stop:570 length:489 start_codon:yes stop_codon:yes gene_type:complete
MLGSIDTGGFSEASKAAMMDSDYFNKRKSSNPFSRGFNFLQDQISKLNKKDDDDDDDMFKDYLKKSYKPEKESSRDMLAKFVLDRFGVGGGLGGLGGGGTLMADAGNYQVRYPNQQQPQVVDPGRPASGGIQGGISGAAQGYLASGFNPLGAVVGGIGGLFS